MSLKHLTQFPVPTLKRQSSDNVASLRGKILLGSEIQEKNAENNLLENQSNIKRTKSLCSNPASMLELNTICILYIQYMNRPFSENAAPDLYVFANILYTFKQNQKAKQDLVLSVSLSQVLHQRKQDLSHVLRGEALF